MDQCNTLSKREGYKRYIASFLVSLKTCKPTSCRTRDLNEQVRCNTTNVRIFLLLCALCEQVEAVEADIESESKRDSWGNGWEFLMSCIALSVGLGNVWRFPFTALDNGGDF